LPVIKWESVVIEKKDLTKNAKGLEKGLESIENVRAEQNMHNIDPQLANNIVNIIAAMILDVTGSKRKGVQDVRVF
jgi:hypothetical protein